MKLKDDFKFIRWINCLSRGTIILFSIRLLIELNLIAARYFVRPDTTHPRKYSLTQESLAYINQIERPVDIITRHFVPHSITNLLVDNQRSTLAGQSRPARLELIALLDNRKTTASLLVTSSSNWSKKSYPYHKKDNQHDETIDRLGGPIPILTLYEHNRRSQLTIKGQKGRLIEFGNSHYIANNHFNALSNKAFLKNTVCWFLDRPDLLNIPLWTIDTFPLILSREYFSQIAMAL